jgi:hypothetical protein
MSKTSFFLTLIASLTFALAATQLAQAQVREDASRLYGHGVHAYFAGNSSQAETCLSSALELNTNDPRYYYFRGLALLRMGRSEEARGDMILAAQLEAQHPGRFAVGAALERVQGADRLLLERFRREARCDAGVSTDQPASAHVPAPSTTDRDSAVLRHKLMIPLDQFLQPGGPQPVVDSKTPTPPPQPTFAPAVKPTAPTVAPENPFHDDPQPQPGNNEDSSAPTIAPTEQAPPKTSLPVEIEKPTSKPAPKTTPPSDNSNPFDF